MLRLLQADSLRTSIASSARSTARMRYAARVTVLAAFATLACAADAQDLAVVAITAPANGGCAPGNGNQDVSIRLFNYGPNLPAGTAFNLAYTLNAGAPVVELAVLGSTLLSNSQFDYTFTTQTDLSVPGTYAFDATVGIAGDVNPSNDAFTGHVVSYSSPTVGGTTSGPAGPVFAGSIVLTDYSGAILEWQQSEDGGRRWRRLAVTDATLAFDQLRHDTTFRASVRNGECPTALSSPIAVQSSDPIFYSGFES
jgi:hypothetical protein